MTRATNYKPTESDDLPTTTSSRAWLEQHATVIRANLERLGTGDLADMVVGEVPC